MKRLLLLILLCAPVFASTNEVSVPLQHTTINPTDQASLQRGAKWYINECLGCHSMAYLRYNRMAEGVGMTDSEGKIYSDLLQQNLIFTGAKISDAILSAMPADNAAVWFGVKPPDLTLITRIRGVDWVYTFLKSFYNDPKRPWGVNNLVFPDVAMPNVLASLQGIQEPLYQEKIDVINDTPIKIREITHLALIEPGSMTQHQFDAAVNDLVNFLAFGAAPEKIQRQYIGEWVLLFLIIFSIVAYLLKREYWKNIS